MSNETLRSLLGLEGVGRLEGRLRRQQITPDINFTCDGVITKWIIGAVRVDNPSLVPGPELQLWRNTGNGTYVKINGTLVTSETSSSSLIYENSSFSPIPFQAGDVLGIFVPPWLVSSLRLRSEAEYGPLNYFIATEEDARMSPYDEVQLFNLSSDTYHPLVSLEICELKSCTLYHLCIYLLTALQSTTSITHSETKHTESSTTVVPVFSMTVSEPNKNGRDSEQVFRVGVAVGVAVVVLIAGALILISVTVCLRQRKKKKELLITASSAAYHSASGQLSMTKDTSAEEYDYVSTHSPHPDHTPNISGGGVVISSNEAYGVTLREDMTENVAYGVGQNEVELGGNVAYGVGQNEVEMKDNEAYTTAATGGGANAGEDGNEYEYVTRNEAYGIS